MDGQGAVEGVHLPGLDGEVPAVRVLEATAFGFVGHVAADRLVDQPVELDRADPVRGRRHVPVHKPRGVHGQEEGLLGDPARQPRPQVTGLHPLPHPGQPVAELEGVADVPLPRIRRHPERRGELGHRELRHPRRTLTGDRHPRLAVRTRGEGLGLQDRVHRVHGRPVHRRLEQPGLGLVGDRAAAHAQSRAPRQRCRVSSVRLVMDLLKHRPPTLNAQNPVVERICGKNFRTATTAVDPRTAPRAGCGRNGHRNPRRRATTPIDNRGDHRPPEGPRQARPTYSPPCPRHRVSRLRPPGGLRTSTTGGPLASERAACLRHLHAVRHGRRARRGGRAGRAVLGAADEARRAARPDDRASPTSGRRQPDGPHGHRGRGGAGAVHGASGGAGDGPDARVRPRHPGDRRLLARRPRHRGRGDAGGRG